jgi:hypothetical protein
LTVGLLPPGGGGDLRIAPAHPFAIADSIQRREHSAGKFRRLLEHRLTQLERRILKARKPPHERVIDQLAEYELHIRQRCLILLHCIASRLMTRQ